MANAQAVKLKSFKRGDTVSFTFVFSPPFVGYSWTGVTLDCAMTSVTNPTDNTGAGAVRQNQMLTIDATNTATWIFQLTRTESLALVPGTTYKIEPQLKETVGGIPYVGTAFTGEVEVLQDYTI